MKFILFLLTIFMFSHVVYAQKINEEFTPLAFKPPLEAQPLFAMDMETQTPTMESALPAKGPSTREIKSDHKMYALIAAGLFAGAIATSQEGEEASIAHRSFAIGAASMYSMALIKGLKLADMKGSWGTWHPKLALAHISFVGLTVISGIQANDDAENNKDPEGVGKYHKNFVAAAGVTLAATLASVYFEF